MQPNESIRDSVDGNPGTHRDAVVVGAGIIGLTSALALSRAGFRVRIIAAGFTPATVSDVAAAIWYPYQARPRDRVFEWSRRTFSVLASEARHAVPGISMLEMVEVFASPVDDPWWGGAVESWRRCGVDELPDGYIDGFAAVVPLIESTVYLNHLMHELGRANVPFEHARISNLADIGEQLVINCTGLGARELCNDDAVFPIRGVVVRTGPTSLRRSLADDFGPNALAYIVPRSVDCVLGGTADFHSWRLDATPEEAGDIVRRCEALEPALRGAEILETRVGLRPGRTAVRCERDPDRPGLIHNYGHGGSGFTLCWGCAADVVRLATESVGAP